MKTSEDVLGEQPTVIRGSVLEDDRPRVGTASDSDVRLILDDSLTADSAPESDIIGRDSDSDVRLVEDSGPSLDTAADSDSDVQLIPPEDASDSDVQLVPSLEGDSDSDVELVDELAKTDRDVKLDDSIVPRSDSDVRLVDSGLLRSDSDVQLVPSGSGARLADDSSVLHEDSGVTLGAGSSVALAGSGVELRNVGDSGIALERAGSGAQLDRGDSGIALEGLDDSGISLSDDSVTLAGDSGIALGKPIDSGLSLDEDSADELNATVPMLKASGLDEELDGTDLEVPALDDSEFELEGEGSGETDTSVILFDEEGDLDDGAAVKKKKGAAADDFEGETLDFEASEFEEELEVSDDLAGEDEELDDLDVFDAGDEDFEGDFETGESHAEFVAPAGGRMAVAAEQDWGVGTFVGLVVATLVLMICGTMVFDLVRYMWQPAAEDQVGPFLSMFKDLI
jgi:hypothetical protein